MAVKPWTEVRDSFADNNQGAITAENMRDFVDTARDDLQEGAAGVTGVADRVTALEGGATLRSATLLEWALAEAYDATAVTYDDDLVVEAADVRWPDGSSGEFSRTAKNNEWFAVDAFSITHVDSGKTVMQPVVTRDANGNVSVKPVMEVS